MADLSSKGGEALSGDDPSVTSVAGPSVIRERTPDLERGMVLAGRYQVEAIIGKGGSGIVLRAFDRTAQTVVAVKVLKPELVHDERWSKRFSRELRLGRPIRHPNVCRIFDIGEGDGHRFLTMELAGGGTLRDLIKRGEPLRPLEERLKDAGAAIGGLAAIHEAGIVHRDVKPDNMLRMDDGRLVLSDFGLATDLPTAAAVTVMIGTPHYMAPEVRAGEPATTRSDVWALGVVLYEIFFGKRPEKRSSMSSEGMSKPPAPLTASSVERAMLYLSERCLAENPMERPPDARAVQRLFDQARSSPRRFVRRGRVLSLVLVLLTAAIAGSMLRSAWKARHIAGLPAPQSGIVELTPTGQPIDWSREAFEIARVEGRVHCFSMLDGRTARMIWGKPRRAEDIDIGSKKIRPASLLPETYALGCPDLSPEGKELLFTAETSGGTSEIRVSKNRDGSASTSVTPGADPLWMGTGEEFLYELDGTHPAMFSLATMKFSLLPDPGLGGGETISGKAVSRSTGKVAILYFNEQVRYALAVYNPGESNHRTFMVPAARRVEFETATDRLLVSYDPSVRLSSMTEVDWRSGTSRHLGRYPGLELADALPNGNAELIVLGRQLSSDVWLVQGGTRRRLTSDGRNLTAALSPNGDVLVSKLLDDGRSTIWRQASDGTTRELTSGPNDVSPGFSSDGRSWAYVDYARKSLMLCSAARWTCELLRSDENLPGWPRFSPGGNLLAYVTQSKVPHLTVMSLRDRTTRQISAVHAKCPPEWSSPTTLWELEGTAEQYAWVERDVISGAKTGKRAELGVGHDPEESGCAPPSDRPDSGSLQRVRIESQEKDQLLKVALRR